MEVSKCGGKEEKKAKSQGVMILALTQECHEEVEQ